MEALAYDEIALEQTLAAAGKSRRAEPVELDDEAIAQRIAAATVAPDPRYAWPADRPRMKPRMPGDGPPPGARRRRGR